MEELRDTIIDDDDDDNEEEEEYFQEPPEEEDLSPDSRFLLNPSEDGCAAYTTSKTRCKNFPPAMRMELKVCSFWYNCCSIFGSNLLPCCLTDFLHRHF